MRKYSLQKLKLDLDRMVSRPHYSHRADDVKGLCKHVSAKWVELMLLVSHININMNIYMSHINMLIVGCVAICSFFCMLCFNGYCHISSNWLFTE